MKFPWLIGLLMLASVDVIYAAEQNPSPMVEHTREHPRLKEQTAPGERIDLSKARLFVPEALKSTKELPLLICLHGGHWLPQWVGAQRGLAVISIQEKGGYAQLFKGAEAFAQLLEEAATESQKTWSKVSLAGWSAGCAGLREIAKHPNAVAKVHEFIFIDGIHTSYVEGKPGPLESKIDTETLAPIVALCRKAMADDVRVLITHSEIFPGTFASTTETADWLLREIGMKREALLKWGPMKTQQLSEATQGRFALYGFAGNAAPDHVDQLHALESWIEVQR